MSSAKRVSCVGGEGEAALDERQRRLRAGTAPRRASLAAR